MSVNLQVVEHVVMDCLYNAENKFISVLSTQSPCPSLSCQKQEASHLGDSSKACSAHVPEHSTCCKSLIFVIGMSGGNQTIKRTMNDLTGCLVSFWLFIPSSHVIETEPMRTLTAAVICHDAYGRATTLEVLLHARPLLVSGVSLVRPHHTMVKHIVGPSGRCQNHSCALVLP